MSKGVEAAEPGPLPSVQANVNACKRDEAIGKARNNLCREPTQAVDLVLPAEKSPFHFIHLTDFVPIPLPLGP